jgi:type II secretion system protein G
MGRGRLRGMRRLSAGFTLLELMVVISIIGILSAIIIANLQGANARGRDAQRQSDLRELQIAIEAYKRVNGQYPAMGCGLNIGNGDGFASESECPEYIEDLAPQFIDRLPTDPRRDAGEEGYSYSTHRTGTVYKVMAMRTVEAESVTYSHPMKSCDVRFLPDGRLDTWNGGLTNGTTPIPSTSGWCFRGFYADPRGGANIQAEIPDCRQNLHSGSNGRFSSSYGLWGGIVMIPSTETLITRYSVGSTTQVICE